MIDAESGAHRDHSRSAPVWVRASSPAQGAFIDRTSAREAETTPPRASSRFIMKNLFLLLPLLFLALVAPGCIKITSETAIKNDGGATMKFAAGYKLEVLEFIKAQLKQIPGGDEEDEEGPAAKFNEGINKINDLLNDKKASEDLKKAGFEVSKSAATDKDGWKTLEVE